MELREIPFISDPTYRISRDGAVWRVKGSTPRAIKSITIANAVRESCDKGRHPFALLIEGTKTEVRTDANGRTETVEVPCVMAQRVTHVGGLATTTVTVAGHEIASRAEPQGGEDPLVGDPAIGWVCICVPLAGIDRVHIFHGPSASAEIFKRSH